MMTAAEGWEFERASARCAGAEIEIAALVREFGGTLYRVAYSVLRSESDAEDVVQDVFVKVLEQEKKLGEIRDMRVWLVRIAWNGALDRRRRIRPEQMDERFAQSLAAKSMPADEALAETRKMAAVVREIDRLPKEERAVLLLSAVEELSTAEMAKVLGRTESGTRALLFRARTRLRERLGKEGL